MLAAIEHCQQLLGAVPSDSEVTPLPFTKLPLFLEPNGQEICKKCLEKLKVVTYVSNDLLPIRDTIR